MTGTAIAAGVAGVVLGGIIGYLVRRLLDARQIRYRHLYERRAEVIARLYKLVIEAGDALNTWAAWFGGYRKEQQPGFERGYNRLLHYYRTNSLWLDNQTRQALDTFFKETREVRHLLVDLREYRSAEDWNDFQSGSESPMSKAEARSKIERKVTVEIPKLEEQLREDFREIIEISDLRDRDAPRRFWWRRVFGF